VRRGRGEPLVLLHTLGTDHRMWDPVLERLAERRDVIAVDMPGFGGSPVLGNGSGPADLAAAIGVFCAEQGVQRPHVAGNSLGGWVALELALAGGARTVTAIGPAGLWRQPLMPKRSVARTLARISLPVLPLLLARPEGRRAALLGTMAHPERVPPDAARRLVRAYATAPGFQAANDAMRAGTFRGLDAIAVPVTLAWGEHDRIVAPPRRLPPNVRAVELPGCGHLPTWDDPDGVAAVLLAGSGG
jgi:pimeloyl-ACP methyl ester carboxylesterase